MKLHQNTTAHDETHEINDILSPNGNIYVHWSLL